MKYSQHRNLANASLRLILLSLMIIGALFVVSSRAGLAKSPQPLRIGVVGYEGHGALFTRELNAGLGPKIGLVVSHVWHREPIPQEEREKYGFAVVPSPEAMIGKVDGIFIAEPLPFRYPELAAPFIKAGVRTFVARILTSAPCAALSKWCPAAGPAIGTVSG